MVEAVLAGSVRLPRNHVPEGVLTELRVKVQPPGEEPEVIKAYTVARRWVHLPRQYGLDLCEELGLEVTDKTSEGTPLPKLKPIKLRDGQEPWVEQCLTRCGEEYDFIARAPTGKGKTVMSLEVARRLGRSTLVLVDQERLLNQWVDRIGEHLGFHDVGIIRQSCCEHDKPFVVGMIQTLYNREYPSEVYDAFGLVIVDEVHTAGAPQYSRVLSQFSATNRFGISATPNRKDALNRVLRWNLGPVAVEMAQTHRASQVRYVESYGVYSWYANTSPKIGRFHTEVASDGVRNLLLARVLQRLYEQGRQILAIGDRIEQLEGIMALCAELGIPESNMGIMAAQRHVWKYAKDPHPRRKPDGLQKDADYTPVSLQMVRKRTAQSDLDDVSDTRQIIFATYGLLSKGVDIPRLDAGLDLTPRSGMEQVHGRILRERLGKLMPVWVTIRDVNSHRAEWLFAKRLDEFKKSNVEVVEWDLELGVRKREVAGLKQEAERRSKVLKSVKIVTRLDGSYTLPTQIIETKRKHERGSGTEKRTRARSAA